MSSPFYGGVWYWSMHEEDNPEQSLNDRRSEATTTLTKGNQTTGNEPNESDARYEVVEPPRLGHMWKTHGCADGFFTSTSFRVSGLSTQRIQCERLALIAKAHYFVSAPILPHVLKDRFVLFTFEDVYMSPMYTDQVENDTCGGAAFSRNIFFPSHWTAP